LHERDNCEPGGAAREKKRGINSTAGVQITLKPSTRSRKLTAVSYDGKGKGLRLKSILKEGPQKGLGPGRGRNSEAIRRNQGRLNKGVKEFKQILTGSVNRGPGRGEKGKQRERLKERELKASM